MTLDRNASRILQMLATAGGGAAQSYDVAAVRRSMLELARALDPREPPAVLVDDRSLPGPGGALLLRRYAPAGTPDASQGPGLLYFHGGVGVFGSVQTHDAVCRMLCADGGLRVLSLEYRLAPEHPAPAALEDAWAAAQWICRQAAGLGLEHGRIAVGGDSAGATLAAAVTQRARAQGAPALAAQLLLCPVTDLCAATASRGEFAQGYFPSGALLRWAVDLACPAGVDRRDPQLSPLRAADFAGLPAAVIHTAQYDPFRDEGAAYAEALRGAGVRVAYACHPGLIHHYYGMAGAIPAARAALRQAALELRQLLDGAR
jgi:acetyl esterase/lipase